MGFGELRRVQPIFALAAVKSVRGAQAKKALARCEISHMLTDHLCDGLGVTVRDTLQPSWDMFHVRAWIAGRGGGGGEVVRENADLGASGVESRLVSFVLR